MVNNGLTFCTVPSIHFIYWNSQIFFIMQIKELNEKKRKEKKLNMYTAVYKITSLKMHSIPTLLLAHTSSVLSLKGETNPPFSYPPLFLSLMRSLGSHAMCYS